MNQVETPTKFYRYEAVQYSSYNEELEVLSYRSTSLELREYNLHKETPKGYWIGYGKIGEFQGSSRWVSKTSRKRFAYPSKKEAIDNFIARSERRIKILDNQISSVRIALNLAKEKKKNKNLFF